MEAAFEFPVVRDYTVVGISWLEAAILMENSFPLVIASVKLEREWRRMRIKENHHERGEHDAEMTFAQKGVETATCTASSAWACIVVARRKTEMLRL